jgi:hypothetical protein
VPVHDMTTARYCRNPSCPRPTVPLDPERVRKNGATTCDDKCRAAAWKAEHGYGRHDGVSGRANGSQARRKRSGAQVSWGKAVAAFSAYLQAVGYDAEDAEVEAVRALRPALSERQRKQLEDRESERETNV